MHVPLDRLYPLIAVAALAAATFWLERVATGDDTRAPVQMRSDPDFIGEKVRLVSFDPTGNRIYELIADRITHYPRDDVSDFEAPRLRYDQADGMLHIVASHGVSRNAGEEILLTGDVEVVKDGAQRGSEMTLTSSSLRLWPDDQRAETSDPVVLTRGSTVATADGMKADSLLGTLQLLGNAHVSMPRSQRNRP